MQNEEEFRKALRRKGKKPDVVDRNVSVVLVFETYLKEIRKTTLDIATREDIEAYVEKIESKKKSAKGTLYVLMNYFRFAGQTDLLKITAELREVRTKKSRRIFPLKEFLDINQEHIQKLADIGIKNVDQMLESGKTKQQREKLSEQLGIPEEAILELVKLSDITRMGYVRAKLSRLYYNAGLDSPLKVAAFDSKDLHEFFTKFVNETNWDGMVPNPSDLVSNINNARKLKKVVEE